LAAHSIQAADRRTAAGDGKGLALCGIFGWATTRPVPEADQVLRRALSSLAHRGPDGSGTWFEHAAGGEIAFGHRRLAIIGIATGHQPLFSHDDRFAITFNGEIYNYIELRELLVAKGHRFNTDSDTEVVLEAYRAWGNDCLSRLRGMFAFALYDRRERTLLLARDPFGKKPLYCADLPGGFAFSSEIRPLIEMPGVRTGLNLGVLGEYMLSRYVSGPATFFEGVRKLPPGCCLVLRDGVRSETRYFTPPFAQRRPRSMTMREAVARFAPALEEAVRIRMRSEAPFGAYLSGGLDSSLIVALMTRHSAGPVTTFSVGFEDASISEHAFGRIAAEQFRTDHHELIVSSSQFFETWADAVWHRGAPVSEPADIPILLLSRAARSHVKMVLTGEGADELLGGYPKYRAERYIGLYQACVPPGLHRRLIDPLVRALPYRWRRVKILSRALTARSPDERAQVWFASETPDLLSALLPSSSPPPKQPRLLCPDWIAGGRRLQLLDQQSWLPDNLLERGDRMMMAGSIEGRMPFMDAELAAVVADFPDSVLSHGRGKLVARQMAKDLLDRRILERSKNGFRVPVGAWFRTEQREAIRELLDSRASHVREILDGKVLRQLLEEHMSARQNHEKVLWTIANLEMFLRQAQSRPASLASRGPAKPAEALDLRAPGFAQ
jgi:asparagine synthase (glutamine-hydrolysing)